MKNKMGNQPLYNIEYKKSNYYYNMVWEGVNCNMLTLFMEEQYIHIFKKHYKKHKKILAVLCNTSENKIRLAKVYLSGYFISHIPTEFKRIKEYPEFAINEDGIIIRIKRRHIMKVHLDKYGYYKVFLLAKYTAFVHRLVGLTYLTKSNDINATCINHKDGNKINNNKYNLEWVTILENNLHALRTGLKNLHGEHNGRSKLLEKDVIFIRNTNLSTNEIMKKYSIGRTTISDILNNKSWKYLLN